MTGNTGPAGTATAYAAFGPDGTISPISGGAPIGGSPKGISQSDETTHLAGTGVYCFHSSFTPKSAMVSAIDELPFASSPYIVANVTIRTNGGIFNCGPSDTVRVRTYVVSNGATYSPAALTDEPFILWLE